MVYNMYASLPYKVLFLLLVIEQPRVPKDPQLLDIHLNRRMDVYSREESECWMLG